MYVCVCKAVTDHQIREAVEQQGCCTMRDLRNCFGVATQCGRCAVAAKDVLNESLVQLAKTIPVVA